jgi:hypothetical protein
MAPKIFGDTPIVRGRHVAVELVLGMFAPGETIETIVEDGPVAAGRTATDARKGLSISNGFIGLGDRHRAGLASRRALNHLGPAARLHAVFAALTTPIGGMADASRIAVGQEHTKSKRGALQAPWNRSQVATE